MQCDTAILCETVRHMPGSLPRGSLVVALSPEVAWKCQQQGLPYVRLEDYYSAEALLRRDRESFEDQIAWVRWVDSYLGQHIAEFGKCDFHPAQDSLLLLRALFNELYTAAYILGRFLGEAQPKRVRYAPWTPVHPEWNLGFRSPVYSSVLPAIAPRHGCQLEPIEPVAASAPLAAVAAPARAARWKSGRLWNELRLCAKAGAGPALAAWLKEGRLKRCALLTRGGYDLDPLALALRRSGFSVRWMPPAPPASESMRARLAPLWEQATAVPDFWHPLVQWGLGRNERAERALWWCHRIIPQD